MQALQENREAHRRIEIPLKLRSAVEDSPSGNDQFQPQTIKKRDVPNSFSNPWTNRPSKLTRVVGVLPNRDHRDALIVKQFFALPACHHIDFRHCWGWLNP